MLKVNEDLLNLLSKADHASTTHEGRKPFRLKSQLQFFAKGDGSEGGDTGDGGDSGGSDGGDGGDAGDGGGAGDSGLPKNLRDLMKDPAYKDQFDSMIRSQKTAIRKELKREMDAAAEEEEETKQTKQTKKNEGGDSGNENEVPPEVKQMREQLKTLEKQSAEYERKAKTSDIRDYYSSLENVDSEQAALASALINIDSVDYTDSGEIDGFKLEESLESLMKRFPTAFGKKEQSAAAGAAGAAGGTDELSDAERVAAAQQRYRGAAGTGNGSNGTKVTPEDLGRSAASRRFPKKK